MTDDPGDFPEDDEEEPRFFHTWKPLLRQPQMFHRQKLSPPGLWWRRRRYGRRQRDEYEEPEDFDG